MKRIKAAPSILFACLAVGGPAVEAQEDPGPWRVNIHLANMVTVAVNDRWYITSEGYHVHPASDSYMPGVKIGISCPLAERIQVDGEILYGLAPAYLAIIDENSQEEFRRTERFGFLGALLSPTLTFREGEIWSFRTGPTLGYGWAREHRVTPSFGPPVVFGGNSQPVFGGKIAFVRDREGSPLSFSGEVFALSMGLDLLEEGMFQEMSKPFGPVGLSLGVSYRLGPGQNP